MNLLYENESYKIIGTAMKVHKELGSGFLEAVYQEALGIEFEKQGIPYLSEPRLKISYSGQELKKYYKADFICYEKIIIEVKATKQLTGIDESQVINYLKATSIKLGLLFNFGTESLEYKRLIRL